MIIIKKYFNIYLLISLFSFVYPQTKEIFVYNIEAGLPSNLIKTVFQDRNGFLWIGSDAGLAQFDGTQIINYTHLLSSHYVKDIKEFDDTTFIVVTDDDIYKVSYHFSKYTFRTISTLYNQPGFFFDYPKSVFIDTQNRIWISGIQSVFCIDKDSIYTFTFSEDEVADSYFRSFQVFENENGDIFILSYHGSLFHFDSGEMKVNLVDSKLNNKNRNIYAINKTTGNNFLIGTTDGLFHINIINNKINIEGVEPIEQVSSIVKLNDSLYYIGTWGQGVFEYDFRYRKKSFVKEITVNSIKSMFVDNRNTLLIATDEGVFQLKNKIFYAVDIKSHYSEMQNLFVRSSSGLLDVFYYTDTQGLFKGEKQEDKISIKHLDSFGGDQIYSIASYDNFMWISFTNNKLVLYDLLNKNIVYQTDFEEDRAANLFIDSQKNLWGYFERQRQILKIDRNMNLSLYELNYEDIILIQVFKEDRNGMIICSGRGEKFFLLGFDEDKNSFIRLEIKNDIEYSGNIIVYDLDISDDEIYIAESSGLFLYKNNLLERITLPDVYDQMPVKSVSIVDKNKLWLGTDIGLVHINENRFSFFNKVSGLSNSTIAPKGIYSDENGNVWIGTASGVSYFNGEYSQIEKTTPPIITGFSSFEEKGEQKGNILNNKFLFGSSLDIDFVSINFPAHQIKYRYRIIGQDTVWSEYFSSQSLIIHRLPVGNYFFEIKAQANGLFESVPVRYSFSVIPPWYLTIYAYIIYAVLALSLIYFISWIVSNYKIKQYKKREAELSRLVNEKTRDLQNEKEKTEQLLKETEKARAELERANELKNQLLSVAAHDLKNPLNSVMCFSSIILEETREEEVKSMAEMINNSSQKMLQLIIDLLEGAALQSKDIKLSMKPVNIGYILQKVVSEYSIRAEQKSQKIISDIPEMLIAEVDSIWLTHALENILSNAVKYSPLDGLINVTCKEENELLIISVKDDGPGFTKEDKELLFGKFQRLSAKPTGGETSTGLGLSIVKDIIDKHNGKTEVESEYGKGSTFIISIPIKSK